jgi:hypothetical protein
MPRLTLSSRGRQEVGAWLANRLAIACGASFALVFVPSLTGKTTISALMLGLSSTAIVVLAVAAIVVKYSTAERAGEAAESTEASRA